MKFVLVVFAVATFAGAYCEESDDIDLNDFIHIKDSVKANLYDKAQQLHQKVHTFKTDVEDKLHQKFGVKSVDPYNSRQQYYDGQQGYRPEQSEGNYNMHWQNNNEEGDSQQQFAQRLQHQQWQEQYRQGQVQQGQYHSWQNQPSQDKQRQYPQEQDLVGQYQQGKYQPEQNQQGQYRQGVYQQQQGQYQQQNQYDQYGRQPESYENQHRSQYQQQWFNQKDSNEQQERFGEHILGQQSKQRVYHSGEQENGRFVVNQQRPRSNPDSSEESTDTFNVHRKNGVNFL